MTHDRRTDPIEDETRVAERPVAEPQSAQPAGRQVNVNPADGPTYVEPATPGPLSYVSRVLSLLFGILAVLLGLRILLLLLVANAGNAIVDFIYTVTEPFVAPFRGIFALDEVIAGDATLDIAALVALVGWLLIYLLLVAILRLGDRDRMSVT
jgi:uncharacterized protein YggT (Ycf19 family)